MADAKRPTNDAPGTVNVHKTKSESRAKHQGTANPSEVAPQQAPGLPPGQNTPTVQRSVDPNVSGAQGGPGDPNFDNESHHRTPIQQSIPSGAQPAGGTALQGNPEGARFNTAGAGAPTPVGEGNVAAVAGSGKAPSNNDGTQAGPTKPSEEMTGAEKLAAMAESLPEDTPDNHVLFGYGGHNFTVGDLRSSKG